MTTASGRHLALALDAWKRYQRVSWAHIARHGKLARNTIDRIRDGTTRQPDRETLRALAVGLATDPESPYDQDVEIADRIVRELFAITGYAPIDDEAADDLIEIGLRHRYGTTKARALARTLAKLGGLEVAEIERVGSEISSSAGADLSTE